MDAIFNHKMYRARKLKHIESGRLAELVGVSRETIRRTENGQSEPKVGLALAIAKVLEVSVEELFGGAVECK